MELHKKERATEKPFKFQECGKSFRVSSDLIKHQRICQGMFDFKESNMLPFLNDSLFLTVMILYSLQFLFQERMKQHARCSQDWGHRMRHVWTPFNDSLQRQQPCMYSVQFSRSVVSDSLWPHELQHARPPCPSQTPGVYSNSCPSSQWCHPAISSSVFPFSSCPQSLQASESFPMSQLFTWGGQSIGVSASALVLPMNTQDWSALGWTGWISLQSKGLSRVFYNTTVQKHQL